MSADFSRVRLIAMREWLQKIRQRSFLVASAAQILVVLGLILAPVVLSAIFGGDDDSSAAQVVVVNRTDLDDLTGDLNEFATVAGFAEQVTFRGDDRDAEATEALADADGVITVTRDSDDVLAFVYTNEQGELDQTAMVAHAAAGEVTLKDNLIRLGIDPNEARQVRTVPRVTVQAAGDVEAAADDTEENFRYAVAYASAFVMYIVVLIYGMWVAQGVVEEKSSRIMEIMINAATPTDLMFGKIIGIGLAGLTQVLPTVAIAGIGLLSQQWLADALGVTGLDLGGIDFGAISATLVGFFLIYFLLGFMLYGALYAGVGSLVSRQEDVQTAMAPMTFAVVIGFFGAIITLGAPDGVVAKTVSIIPFTSPMAMMPRILLGDPSNGEIALSIALLALTGVLAVVFAARIYRMGVLMYGQKPSLRVVFRRNMTTAAR